MKEKRKILIDYHKWLQKNNYTMIKYSYRECADNYIESINNAQSESQTVIENEQSKEVCRCLTYYCKSISWEEDVCMIKDYDCKDRQTG